MLRNYALSRIWILFRAYVERPWVTGRKPNSAFAAWALLASLLALAAGCKARQSHEAAARELVGLTEEMARILSDAKTLKDLRARGTRLKALAARGKALEMASKRLGKAPARALVEYGPRLNAAMEKIADVMVSWSEQEKWDMLAFVDDLKGG